MIINTSGFFFNVFIFHLNSKVLGIQRASGLQIGATFYWQHNRQPIPLHAEQ